MESHLRVDIVPRTPGGYLARINGAEFPVIDVAVQTEGGLVMSLVLAPDSLSIGDPRTGATSPPVRDAAPQVRSWGDGSHPDPRERIAGWAPERLGGQVAGHAETRAFGDESVRSRVQRPSADPAVPHG